jgi:antimicrobial peptide system SdpB family protein
MLTRIGVRARRWAADQNPWTNVYGLARTLLALGTATTLAFTHSAQLFGPAAGILHAPVCDGVRGFGAFCLVPERGLELARWVAVLLLLVTASGWRPRVTALLQFWIAFSFQNNATIIDGGDQATLVLSILLLPVALTDSRVWHWGPAPESKAPLTGGEEMRRLVALFALLLVRVQVAGIYFHAAIGKFGVEEWVDGTAVYYFFLDPTFGASAAVLPFLRPILKSAVGVCLISWGTLVLEYLLSAALFMPKRYWRPLLVAGLALHAGIIMVHGLVSFGFAMFAALVLYLRPIEAAFDFSWLGGLCRLFTPARRPTAAVVDETSLLRGAVPFGGQE